MKKVYDICAGRGGFSLAEVLASLTIAALVLVAILGIYHRAETSASKLTHRLDSSRLPSEILQRIAEDLDTIIASGSDTRITIENKIDKGYPSARLTIQKSIVAGTEQTQQFETIVWQTGYDYESDANGLVLYRSHSGIGLEDKMLDEHREKWERELFVPVCSGVTIFRLLVPRGEEFLNIWRTPSLPHGIVATISFVEPFQTIDGTLDVLDDEKVTRTIAVDRTRRIRFTLIERELEEDAADANDVTDANGVTDANDVIDAND